MNSLEGYVYISKEEERLAAKWMRQHEHEIPDLSDGDSIEGKPIIYGLEEHPISGRLIIPRPKKSRQLRDVAMQLANFTDREWKVWELYCKGNSQERIAARIGINRPSVCKILQRIKSKITAARAKIRRGVPVPERTKQILAAA